MKQISLGGTGFEVSSKRTRKREFLEEMNRVVPRTQLVALITPHAPTGKTGWPLDARPVRLPVRADTDHRAGARQDDYAL